MNFENDREKTNASPAPNTNINPEDVKTSIYDESNDENNDNNNKTEFEMRLRSVQDWFIRCSWIDKYTFLAALCELTQEFYVLERILLSTENLDSKDVVSSFSKNHTAFIYDRIPFDDNRSLSNRDLREAMREATIWFFNLGASSQIRVIFSLLRLGGGGLMYSLYKCVNEKHRERKDASVYFLTFSRNFHTLEEKQLEPEMQENDSPNKTDVYTLEKFEMLEKRKMELNDFRIKYDILTVDEKKSQKKIEVKEAVEWIQVLPMEINRQIMSKVEDKELINLRKVGKYWGKMIDETAKEKASRKIIEGRMNQIKNSIPVNKIDTEKDAVSAAPEQEHLGGKALINHKKLKEYEIKYAIGKNKHIASRKWELKVLSAFAFPRRTCAVNLLHKFLASSAVGGTVEFYSLRTENKMVNKVTEIVSPITALALHEGGQHVLIGCEDGTLSCKHIWKNITATLFRGHTKAIISLVSTDESILSASKDNTLKYFHIWSGLCLLCVNLNVGISISVAIPVIDKPLFELVGTEEGRLLIVDLKSKHIKKDLVVHDGNVMGLVQDKDLIITAGTDGKIRIWDLLRLEKGMKPKLYHDVNVKFPVLGIKSLNTQLFAACNDGNIRIICQITGTLFKTIRISSKPITGLELFHDLHHIKVITWTEHQLEMRTISLEKYQAKPKKLKTSTRIKPKQPLIATRLSLPWRRKSHMEAKDSLTDMTVKPKPFKYIPPNRKNEIAEERFCTISELRRSSTAVRKFKTGVFAEMSTRNSQNIIFKPFSRLKRF